MTAPLAWITSVGARSPLGLGIRQVAMCTRAKKSEPVETRVLDTEGVPIGVCRMASLPETIAGYDRLLRLAAPALCEAWPAGRTGPLPLVLALPEAGRADDDPRFAGDFVRDLAARSRRPLDLERSRVVRAGRAGGALAFEAAAAQLASPDGPEAVLVGGVDSYVHPGLLRALDQQRRVHAPSADDGFIPGEGAAFVLLSRTRAPGAVALRRALSRRETDDPNIGVALTELLEALRGDGPIGWVLSDLNHESERLREWTLAEVRVLAGREIEHTRLLEETGDAGAASGPLLAAIAATYFAAGCASSDHAVIVLASDGPERGALRLEAA